jgi:hypothetical protein
MLSDDWGMGDPYFDDRGNPTMRTVPREMASTPESNETWVYTWQRTWNKERKKKGERLQLKNR